jgi:signal transduction histidine kinase
MAQELNRHYLRQKTNLSRAIWLAALLGGGIVVTILVARILRMRQAAQIRERLAADLHDELGANIYTIGLLGEVALNSMNSPERLHDVLQRKQEVIKRTGAAIRHCMNQQEAHGYPGSLHQDMKRIAHRILAGLDYEIVVEGEEFLEKIKADTRDDLRLFYKECLVNVSRHADATEVITRLAGDRRMLRLTVSDNGRGIGMSEAGGRDMPSSLQRRGRFLGAKVFTTPSESGGTCVTLILKWPWMHRMRWGRSRKPRGQTEKTPDNWPS